MSQQSYIVTFKPTASQEQIDAFVNTVTDEGGEVGHRFNIMKGFAAKLNPQTLKSISSLQADPESIIESIEADGVVTTQ